MTAGSVYALPVAVAQYSTPCKQHLAHHQPNSMWCISKLTLSSVMQVQGGVCCCPCQAHTLMVLSAAPDSSTALPPGVTAGHIHMQHGSVVSLVTFSPLKSIIYTLGITCQQMYVCSNTCSYVQVAIWPWPMGDLLASMHTSAVLAAGGHTYPDVLIPSKQRCWRVQAHCCMAEQLYLSLAAT
jgi:hypothetical protein